MPEPHAITQAIPRMRDGDEDGVEVVWEEYFPQLVQYARRKLGGSPKGAGDEEDVALSAMASFCRVMKSGRYQRVDDRDDLWRLLVTITKRKAITKLKYDLADKRDIRRTKREGSFMRVDGNEEQEGLDQLAIAPSAEFADQIVDNCHELLDCLDDKLREVALLTLEGFTAEEIAERLGVIVETVRRRKRRIKAEWSRKGLAPRPR